MIEYTIDITISPFPGFFFAAAHAVGLEYIHGGLVGAALVVLLVRPLIVVVPTACKHD
jgi:hypothetical protein